MDKESPLVPVWAGLCLAALSGFLFYASFPGLDIWPLAFVAWTPWVIALRGRRPAQAALQGLVLGLVIGIFGFYWLLEMLETFSGFPTSLCVVFMLLLVAYQAGRYALMGALIARARQGNWPLVPVFLAAFVAAEQVYPLLFPFTFGATVHEIYPLVQAAELGGPIAVALLVVAPGLALGRVLECYFVARKKGQRGGWGNAVRAAGRRTVLALALAPVLFSIYGTIRIAQIDEAVAEAPQIRVGIVQANMGLGEKRTNLREGLQRHIQQTKKLIRKKDIDLVVWPETAVAGAVPEQEAASYYRKRVTGRLGVPAIVGAVLRREVDDARGSIFFNSALISDAQGEIHGRYDKQFLLAFGEYLPFGDVFPQLYDWSPQSGRFSPGTSYEPLPFGDDEIAVFICYEDIVPRFVNRIMNSNSPELLVNMTNDAWFGDTTEPWEHMALAKLRAVEHRRSLVRATNSGISGFVDPVGRLVAQTPTFERASIAEDVALLELSTPYQTLGDTPFWVISAMAFALAFYRRPARTTPTAGSASDDPSSWIDSTEGAGSRDPEHHAMAKRPPETLGRQGFPADPTQASPLHQGQDPISQKPRKGRHDDHTPEA